MRLTLPYAVLTAALLTLAIAPWAVRPSPADQAAPTETAAVPGLALPGPPAAPSGGEGFQLSYDVYKSGLRALSLDFDVALDAGRYRTDARLESAGIVGWLFEWSLDAVSSGRLRDAAVVPQRHRFANSWRGKERAVEISYQAGIPAEVRAKPPYDDNPERRVAADLLPGAVDPMSAATAIVLETGSGALCRPTTAVYDGRRRYDARLSPLGARTLKASNFAAYAGPAEGCHLSFKRIAGFNPSDERMKNISVDVWWADVGIGAGRIPVRLRLHTPWGTGFAHLAQARRADGTLVFGTAE